MAAREGSLLFKEELSAKRTIIREDPEGSRQTNINSPQLLDDNIVIDIDSCETSSSTSLVSSDHEWINSMVNVGSSSAGNDQGPKIPRVPDMLRNKESNEGCYDPVVVSIGPYHHEKPHLQEIEKLKAKWAMQFVEEIDGALICLTEKVKRLYEEVKKVADEARKYYDGTGMDVSNEKFTRMMFLDGCFILHFIYLHNEKRSEMGMRNHLVAFVRRDLFLLENQLPYIVLEALMRKRFKPDEGKKAINKFIKLTRGDLPPNITSWWNVNYDFRSMWSSKQTSRPEDDRPASKHTEDEREDHLLNLLRKQFVSSKGGISPARDPNNNNNNKSTARDLFSRINGIGWHTYRSAKELKSVGIRFKANTSGEFNDVRFASHLLSGVLTLPPLTVDDSTKPMLLNLVAWETCPGGPQDFCVTSYICLMDSLLDTVEDVKVLRSHDIVMNYLGSDQQVADLFNDISKNLVPHPNAYSTVKSRIEEHKKNRFNIWIADFLHTRFSSPWTVLAFLGAILAILLTGIQTFLAAFPPNSGS